MNSETVDGKALPYVLMKPDGFNPGDEYPLVVILHGFGASMYDLTDLAPSIDDKGYVYAFPNGPYEVPLGAAARGFSWRLRPGVVQPAEAIPAIEELLDGFITEVTEKSGVQRGNLVLGGFSQGGGLSLRYGLLRPDVFKGLICLSGFFPEAEELRAQLPEQRDQGVFVAHGRQDQVVNPEMGRATRNFLESAGYKPHFREYDMGHQITREVVADLTPWLHETLPAHQSP